MAVESVGLEDASPFFSLCFPPLFCLPFSCTNMMSSLFSSVPLRSSNGQAHRPKMRMGHDERPTRKWQFLPISRPTSLL